MNDSLLLVLRQRPSLIQSFECVNTLRPRQNGRHFADDIFKRIFLNENIWILINISLKFVPKDSINNIPALVQIMAWRRPGDKPLSEPMMVSLLTHICVTGPQWVNERLTGYAPRHPLSPCVAQGLGLLLLKWLTLIPAWISNYKHNKLWDEITYLFRWSLGIDK